MKSAIGIGALLMDGLGDTIRVSLTEDPEFEIVPCGCGTPRPLHPHLLGRCMCAMTRPAGRSHLAGMALAVAIVCRGGGLLPQLEA